MAQKTQRAVIHTSTSTPLFLRDVSMPAPGPGSAVVQILAAPIVSYLSDVLSGKRLYPMSLPLTPGNNATGRGMWACLPHKQSVGSAIPQ